MFTSYLEPPPHVGAVAADGGDPERFLMCVEQFLHHIHESYFRLASSDFASHWGVGGVGGWGGGCVEGWGWGGGECF